MPHYKLLYFNMRGRGEPIRWILSYAEQPFEDERISREKDWPHRKSDTPYGKLPVLFVDDKPVCQSVAICRYLGKCHDLASDDLWEAACGDEVADTVHDLLPSCAPMIYARMNKEIEKAEKLAAEFYTSTLPPVLKGLEKRLEENPWFCGDKLTWVDLFAACYLSQLTTFQKDALNAAPKVKKLVNEVINLAQIQKWLNERPVTTL